MPVRQNKYVRVGFLRSGWRIRKGKQIFVIKFVTLISLRNKFFIFLFYIVCFLKAWID